MPLTICNSIFRNCFRLMRDWKLESLANGWEFPPFRSERKKRSTSEGTPQFPNGISGKLPYLLTSNRNGQMVSTPELRVLVLTKRHRGSGNEIDISMNNVILPEPTGTKFFISSNMILDCSLLIVRSGLALPVWSG